MRVLSEIIRKEPHCKVVVITGNGEKEAALEAIRLGAFDYYQKPIDVEELRVILRDSWEQAAPPGVLAKYTVGP